MRLFFALGYSLGRKSEPALATASARSAAADFFQHEQGQRWVDGAAPPMTFYKAVEQKDANPRTDAARGCEDRYDQRLLLRQLRTSAQRLLQTRGGSDHDPA